MQCSTSQPIDIMGKIRLKNLKLLIKFEQNATVSFHCGLEIGVISRSVSFNFSKKTDYKLTTSIEVDSNQLGALVGGLEECGFAIKVRSLQITVDAGTRTRVEFNAEGDFQACGGVFDSYLRLNNMGLQCVYENGTLA